MQSMNLLSTFSQSFSQPRNLIRYMLFNSTVRAKMEEVTL